MGDIVRIENSVILQGRKNNQIWFAPVIAAASRSVKRNTPEVHVGVIQLVANDFGVLHYTRSSDLGKTWTPPMESLNLIGNPLEDDIFEKPGLYPFYHRVTDTLLGFGAIGFSRDKDGDSDRKNEGPVLDERNEHRRGDLAWALWNSQKGDFEPCHRFARPSNGKCSFDVCFYCSQSHECENGTIIMPLVTQGNPIRIGSCKMMFDGSKFITLEIGSTMVGLDKSPGVHEPSLVEFQGRYLMTIRSECGDFRMYHAASDDGLNWIDFGPWCWDDGTEIETENTQQHWLKHDKSLYLVYTRVNELSNGVFRHRAPLFIAKVDTKSLRLIRETEQIVFPEKGARTCNFSVANVTSDEAWVVSGEWLEQIVPGYKKGMRFWCGDSPAYNRIQYIGDLLLARIHF